MRPPCGLVSGVLRAPPRADNRSGPACFGISRILLQNRCGAQRPWLKSLCKGTFSFRFSFHFSFRLSDKDLAKGLCPCSTPSRVAPTSGKRPQRQSSMERFPREPESATWRAHCGTFCNTVFDFRKAPARRPEWRFKFINHATTVTYNQYPMPVRIGTGIAHLGSHLSSDGLKRQAASAPAHRDKDGDGLRPQRAPEVSREATRRRYVTRAKR